MKRVGFLVRFAAIVAVLFIVPCAAQKLIPYERDGKWGFINSKGETVIKPQFDEAEPFSEGLARVEINLNVGFIDVAGKFVIEPQFRCAFDFSEGLAPVARDCKEQWEYIDHQGRTIIPAKFSWAGKFSEGRAKVLVAPDANAPRILKSGYIDKSGDLVIEAKYGWAESFSDGLALIADNKPNSTEYFNRKAFIDRNGNQVTEFFQDAESFREGLAPVEIDSLWGFIDKTGTVVIPPVYDFVLRPFKEGFAAVNCLNNKAAFIDKTGRKITDCVFEEAWEFNEGLAAVQTSDKKFGFINGKGAFVIKPQFDYARSFLNGLAEVRIIKNGWIYEGYINRQGAYVVKPEKKKKVEDD
ncbi:MAG: WG repeat-containing protein [Acidobacteriota bacterium]|nr:WG repeat-containing protein [Acidobacteriota bacterium]